MEPNCSRWNYDATGQHKNSNEFASLIPCPGYNLLWLLYDAIIPRAFSTLRNLPLLLHLKNLPFLCGIACIDFLHFPINFPPFFLHILFVSFSRFFTIILLHLLLSYFATSTDVHHLKAPTVSNLLSFDRPKDSKSLMEFKWNYSSIKVMGLKAPSTVSIAGQRHSIRNPILCKSTQVNP